MKPTTLFSIRQQQNKVHITDLTKSVRYTMILLTQKNVA